jgi:hypothetical protein
MKKRRRLFERILSLTLCLVTGVLSYRSTTAILDLAGHAKNPTEGRIPTHKEQVDVRENKPRPSKHKLLTRIPRVREHERRAAIDPLLTSEDATELSASVRVRTCDPGREEITKPQYLQLFSAATPGSPHSPPA